MRELYLSNNSPGLEGQLPTPPPESQLLVISAHSMVSGARRAQHGDTHGVAMCARLSPAAHSTPPPSPPPPSQRLTGTVPDVSALTELQSLQLASNELSGTLPPMPASIRGLNLEYNKLRRAGLVVAWRQCTAALHPPSSLIALCCCLLVPRPPHPRPVVFLRALQRHHPRAVGRPRRLGVAAAQAQ